MSIGIVMSREGHQILRFKVIGRKGGRRGRGRSRLRKKVDFRGEDVLCRPKWIFGIPVLVILLLILIDDMVVVVIVVSEGRKAVDP